MAAISELVEKYSKVPGDLRLGMVGWDANCWFAPYFVSDCGNWYGLNEKGESYEYSAASYGWELWQEPKKKKKVAPYLLKRQDGSICMTHTFYRTGAEVMAECGGPYFTIIRRMTELEVEVDE